MIRAGTPPMSGAIRRLTGALSIGAALVILVGGLTFFSSDSVAGASTRTTVTSLKTTPASLTWVGGTVTVHARVTNAATCIFSVRPTIKGLPTKRPCTKGVVDQRVSVPKNTGTKAITYDFGLLVTGSRFEATSVRLTVGTRASSRSSQVDQV
jgi:hypothetical protein